MKILHIGDIAFVASALASELRRRGHEVVVLSKKKRSLTGGPIGGVRYFKDFLDELNWAGVDANDFDLIHVHYLINWGSLGLCFKKIKKPVILHCHGSDTRPKNALERSIQRHVAGKGRQLLYSTPDLKKNIKWFEGESTYLPNPVRCEAAIRYDQPPENRILIYGTLNRVKQTEKLFPFIERTTCQFDMIDIGRDRHFYKRRAPKNVRFLSQIRHELIPEFLKRYPLVIGASQDGTLRVCELEAMALGIPTLFPFRYHEFYETRLPMPEHWQPAVERYFGDEKLGGAQRAWTALFHSERVVVERLLTIYQGLIQHS
jgi:glycosyltransferase involved in cell wall biosynthesis